MKLLVIIASSLFAALLVLIKPAQSVSCYVCTQDDSGCGKSFNYVTSVISMKTECTYCTKSFSNIGVEKVLRGCGTDSIGALKPGCIDATIGGIGGQQCTCTSHLCNGATIARFGFAAALFAVLSVVIGLVVVM